jgi:hypothetical protein
VNTSKYKVHLLTKGFGSLANPGSAEHFLNILEGLGDTFQIERFSYSEPMKHDYDKVSFIRLWYNSETKNGFGTIMFRGKYFNGDITWDGFENKVSFAFALDEILKSKKTNTIVNFMKNIYLWSNAVYGYGRHSAQSQYMPGIDYKTCIANLTWMTLLGLPYVQMFGKEKILSAPCRVEEISENNYMLLTSDEPMFPNEELLALQNSIKIHLGERAFYKEEKNRPKVFTLEDIRAGKDRLDISNYQSPDFSAYPTKERSGGMVAVQRPDGGFDFHKTK